MKKYIFKPYNDLFPSLFNMEKERIAFRLPQDALIEHVGSTAVPGLGGKGIIDIAIAVDKHFMDSSKTALQELGYEFRPSFSTPDRFYFIIYLPDPEEGRRRYHIHLTYPESKEWRELIDFRDYLLSSPETIQEYAELKKTAALEADQDGEKYRKIKAPIFEKIYSAIGCRQVGQVELLNESNAADAVSFLMDNENFSLFLLGNLEAHGYTLGSSPNSGNFKLLRFKGKIIAVFCLTRRGNLVVYSLLVDDWIFEKIMDACKEEHLPMLGLLGEWDFCRKFWNLFQQKKLIRKDTFISKEILYTADLHQQSSFDNPNVRLLTPEDYDKWKPNRIAYLEEEGLPNDLSQTQLQDLFLEKVKGRISWGYFKDANLVSMADFNAKAKDLAQVGGVYTTPDCRRQGYAQAVMRSLMRDARNLHKIRKLIIFTGETNTKARKLYESLNVHPAGYYALMFGEGQHSQENHEN